MNIELYWEEKAHELALYLEQNTTNKKEQAELARKLFDSLTNELQKDSSPTDFIAAPNVVVEIADKQTGQLYRRYLELEYQENDNGIRLLGENMSAEPAQIVFLSSNALHKMHELRGNGPDEPHHKHD